MAKVRKAVVVYQAGIANVFRVTSFNLSDYGRDAVRLFQGDFRDAELIGVGMRLAGVQVKAASCNRAGDISGATWTEGMSDCPFRDSATPGVFDPAQRRKSGHTEFCECASCESLR